ncbi:MAG: anthranilate phosphoribosyltransferase [Phycisphaerae bacterium]
MPDALTIDRAIARVKSAQPLSREQMRAVFTLIMTGQVAAEPMGAFLKALAAKGETVEEIAGAADVMNEHVTRVRCQADCIDTCGTGGDGISTFNVSTAAAILAAAAGATVAKHGNRTNTRVSGSAEAVAALGVNLDAAVSILERCLSECRIAFLFAPHLHPAMRHAAPVRRELGIRTIFNLLGPLTNPAGAKRQLLGVPRPELTETIAQVLAARGATFAWVVHGHNGLCDLTITGPTRVAEVRAGQIRTFTLSPDEFGLKPSKLDALLVNSAAESAAAIQAILEGRETSVRRDHALLNAAAALVVAGLAADPPQGLRLAEDTIRSGAAADTLAALVRISAGS